MSPEAAAACSGLLQACAAGDSQAVAALLAHGVPASHQDDASGSSALMLAAGGGHSAIAALLLEVSYLGSRQVMISHDFHRVS